MGLQWVTEKFQLQMAGISSNPLEPRLVCECDLMAKSPPMQSDCELQAFFSDCPQEAMSSGRKSLCPIDKEKILQISPDNACKREMQTLLVRCRYAKNNGCPWTGTLSAEKFHHVTCEYRTTIWRYCSKFVPVSLEKLHILKECPEVEILLCPNNCNPNRVMKREKLNEHLSAKSGDCPYSVLNCPFKRWGCSFKGVRLLLVKHIKENDLHHLQLLVNRVENIEQERDTDILCIEERMSKFQEFSKAVEKQSVDHSVRIQQLEETIHNCNGILVWKIDGVTRKMDEAEKGTNSSLHSPPFYTNPGGYKMCARCYFNGYGEGRGTHFSLYFTVMRGSHDVFLKWPFQQRVTMTLFNQSGGGHISDTFTPGIHGQLQSFQQPSVGSSMNIPSGYHKFIQLEEFLHGGFIKEDCIIVIVKVDCPNLSAIMVPIH